MSVAFAWIKRLKSFWHVFTASVKPVLTDGKSSIQTPGLRKGYPFGSSPPSCTPCLTQHFTLGDKLDNDPISLAVIYVKYTEFSYLIQLELSCVLLVFY